MIPYVRQLTGLHNLFLTIVVLLAYGSVVTGGALAFWLTLGFPIAMVGAHLFQRARLATPDQNKWWNALIMVVLAGSVFEYFTSSFADPLVIGVRFVLILTLIKLFSRQGGRDELQIYALTFLTLAAASTFNEDFSYGIFFGLYVLSGTFGLALFHLKTEAGRHLQLRAPRTSPFDRYYVSILAGISAIIFISSVLIFFAFPRVGLGLFVDQSRESLSLAGFSENIEVGDHGSVRDNPSVVLRAEFEDGQPSNYTTFRWRTMTFDHYEGGGWSRSQRDSERNARHSRDRVYDLDFLYTPGLREHLDREPQHRIQIYLEPLGTNVLPSLWPSASVRLGLDNDVNRLIPGRTPSLTTDAYGDLRHTMRAEQGMTYRLEVYEPPSGDVLRRQSGRQLSEEDAQRYLQLADVDPRITRLAEELTADAESNFEKAEAIGSHFFREFDYTLDLPPVVGDDPLASFLFETQRGHCEYFASSAAVMLRTVGVPTRVVNGFLGGTWNDVGDYLTVRQGDAHAWIELFVPELGWIPYEPTPPIESTFLERSGVLQFIADTNDAMRQAWLKWVLEYDLQAQVSMLREAGRILSPSGVSDGPDTRQDDSSEQEGLPLRLFIFWTGWLTLLAFTLFRAQTHRHPEKIRYGLGLLALMTIGGVWTGWFQGWTGIWTTTGASSVFLAGLIPVLVRRQAEPSQLREATRHFATIERQAHRAGITRRPDEGAAHFLTRLGARLPSDSTEDLQRFTRLYLDIRFGGRTLGPRQTEELRTHTRAITTAIKRLKT